jgi:hypothetical protein
LIRNERKKTGIVLWTKLGEGFGIVGPSDSRELETDNPDTLYAPYASVTYLENDVVETTPNPAYPQPASRWTITCLNKNGREIERRIICGVERILPKGLPRVFALEPDDRLAIHERLEIKTVLERVPSHNFAHYNEFVNRVKDVLVDRPEADLQALAAELEKLATEI